MSQDENGYFHFPVVLTNQYTRESLEKAVAEFNARPIEQRWGEDRLSGYSPDEASSLLEPDKSKLLLGDVTVELTKDGATVKCVDVGQLPAALLARPYGCEFAIRGTANSYGNGKKELINLVSIDLVKTKTLYPTLDVVGKVLGWSTERKILTCGKINGQISKYYEEVGELASGICRNKLPLIVDSIGDSIVVLTNVLGIAKRDLRVHLRRVEDEVAKTQGTSLSDDPHELLQMHMKAMVNVLGNFAVHGGRMAERLSKDDIEIALFCLYDLADVYDITVDECMSDAWHEIKDRKGYMNSDGVFIKESDA